MTITVMIRFIRSVMTCDTFIDYLVSRA